jgi:hypothetical protein
MDPLVIAFFEQIQTEADLQRLIDEQREEDLHLEFKEKHDRRDGVVHQNDRKSFSETLSAFANSDGGVLIFGVETAKAPNRADYAYQLKPITDVGTFRVRLQDSVMNSTQPSVDGVRIELIPSAKNSGYIKCLIPDSSKPPHRAMFADREYWRRATTGRRRMEHYELEDMFGRRLRPLLRLHCHFSMNENPPAESLAFALLNVGRGIAKHAGFYCRVLAPANITFRDRINIDDCTALNQGSPSFSYYTNQVVVHSNRIAMAAGQTKIGGRPEGTALRLELTWYAEDMMTRRETIDINPGDSRFLEGV